MTVMVGSGWGGFILHVVCSVLFLIWLVLALVVQLVTVRCRKSKNTDKI